MRPSLRFLLGCASLAALPLVAAEETYDAALQRAAADYTERLRLAGDELNKVRTRIADERSPLLKKMRAEEDRIVAAENQIRLLETNAEKGEGDRRKVARNIDSSRRSAAFVASTVGEGAKAYADGLSTAETQVFGSQVVELRQKLDESATAGNSNLALAADLQDLLLDRVELALGGYAKPGQVVPQNSTEVTKGTLAFVGPSTYFLPEGGGTGATIGSETAAGYPVAYPLPEWKPADAATFFHGQGGLMMADVSGGKALHLQQTKGSVLSHIRTGGLVAYAIIVVGFFSLLLILQKIVDLAQMKLGAPEKVRAFCAVARRGTPLEMRAALSTLSGATKKLLAVGVEQVHETRAVLEDHLQAVLMEQQQHFERRLPLLAVIATAAPLMGLLGTVVGMVKTFALITVFGTGNAAKLAGGISEVLVATELGLTVAIPTLIIHGFLSHRIHKNLATLERYALEFVTATAAQQAAPETAATTVEAP